MNVFGIIGAACGAALCWSGGVHAVGGGAFVGYLAGSFVGAIIGAMAKR